MKDFIKFYFAHKIGSYYSNNCFCFLRYAENLQRTKVIVPEDLAESSEFQNNPIHTQGN